MSIEGTPAEMAVITAARRIVAETPESVTGPAAFDLVEALEIANGGVMRRYLLANPPNWAQAALRPARPAGVGPGHRWMPLPEIPTGVQVPDGAKGAWFDPAKTRNDPQRVIWQH